MKYLLFTIMATLFMAGCAKPMLNVSDHQQMPSDSEVTNVPDDCLHLYRPETWQIAVVEFANNTGYQNEINIDNTDTTGVALSHTRANTTGVVAGGRNVAVGASTTKARTKTIYSEDSTTFMTQFAPSLGTFAQSAVEEAIANIGGVQLYNRSSLDQILAEQQFQMTIADPDTVMEFGRLSGVKFILTGSVDYIETKYIQPTQVRDMSNEVATAFTIASLIADTALSGWYVSVATTLTLLNAETGEVVFSQRFEDEARASQHTNFQPDLIINAAKSLIVTALDNSKNYIADHFAITGYVNATRGDKTIAQINLGKSDGVKEGDVFTVHTLNVATDFLTQSSFCTVETVDAEIIISNQIDSENAWGYIKANKKSMPHVKTGAYIKRTEIAK